MESDGDIETDEWTNICTTTTSTTATTTTMPECNAGFMVTSSTKLFTPLNVKRERGRKGGGHRMGLMGHPSSGLPFSFLDTPNTLMLKFMLTCLQTQY